MRIPSMYCMCISVGVADRSFGPMLCLLRILRNCASKRSAFFACVSFFICLMMILFSRKTLLLFPFAKGVFIFSRFCRRRGFRMRVFVV